MSALPSFHDVQVGEVRVNSTLREVSFVLNELNQVLVFTRVIEALFQDVTLASIIFDVRISRVGDVEPEDAGGIRSFVADLDPQGYLHQKDISDPGVYVTTVRSSYGIRGVIFTSVPPSVVARD
jgi:hypothetical protein